MATLKRKKIYHSLRLHSDAVERFREIHTNQRGTQADLFDDMLKAYEEKHLKKGGLFRFGKKEAIRTN